MAINIAPKSLDTELSELMRDVASGKAQLPEFQRSWTWDDGRIRGILASLSQGYPMGAIIRLEYGNEEVKFKYRPVEGVKNVTEKPDYLILDGQQRLTSMYRTACSKDPVETKTDKGKNIKRFYYLDIKNVWMIMKIAMMQFCRFRRTDESKLILTERSCWTCLQENWNMNTKCSRSTSFLTAAHAKTGLMVTKSIMNTTRYSWRDTRLFGSML